MLYVILILSALAVLYIWAVAPDSSKCLEAFSKWDYAHRGLHKLEAGIPENSLAAFSKAVEAGYGIELDVHLTKDLKAVIFHDDSMLRACGVDGKVWDANYEELTQLTLFGTQEKIPLVSEVLELVAGKVPLIIEIKSEKDYKRICTILNTQLTEYRGIYCIESFDPRIVGWFRSNRPDTVRGQLSAKLGRDSGSLSELARYSISNLLTNFMSRPNFIAYKFADRKNISLRLCKRLFKAYTAAWTVRSAEEFKAAKYDFDICIFEGFMPS